MRSLWYAEKNIREKKVKSQHETQQAQISAPSKRSPSQKSSRWRVPAYVLHGAQLAAHAARRCHCRLCRLCRDVPRAACALAVRAHAAAAAAGLYYTITNPVQPVRAHVDRRRSLPACAAVARAPDPLALARRSGTTPVFSFSLSSFLSVIAGAQSYQAPWTRRCAFIFFGTARVSSRRRGERRTTVAHANTPASASPRHPPAAMYHSVACTRERPHSFLRTPSDSIYARTYIHT